jgi:hypothetical protein
MTTPTNGRPDVSLESLTIRGSGLSCTWNLGDDPEDIQLAIDYLGRQKTALLTTPQLPLEELSANE